MTSNSGASGGRLPPSDARNLAAMNRLINSVERADSAERGSAGSSWLDERPNNWDFSSWQPSTTFDNTGARRMKKANEAKEQNHGVERERPRDTEQRRPAAEHFTPEEGRGNHRHRPATFPRTKGPLSQKAALENLRQELSYSDIEEVTMDTGEWNNERSMHRDVRSGLTPLQDMERNEMDHKEAEEGPDSNQIVGRLMQIRDYIKQASTMMERLRKVPDAKSCEQFEKMSGIVCHLKEQEKGYLSLLQKILVSREEDVLMRQNSSTLCQETPSESEATTELDAFVINSSEDDENIARNAMSLSYLENKNGELAALRQQQELLKQMLQQQEQLKALHGRHAALTALQEEAEQGIDAQGATALNNEGSVKSDNRDDLGHGACGGGDDELIPQQIVELRRQLEFLKNTEPMNGHPSPPPAKKTPPPPRPPPPHPPPASIQPDQNAAELEQLSIASTERRQLQDKLLQLQHKKEHMDSLLQELHSMRAERLVLNNEVENGSNCSSVGRMADGMLATASADHTAEEAEELLEMLEARNRLKKLQDVKERLNELKNLVQYYETGNEFIHGNQGQGQIEEHDLEEVSSLVANDFEDLPPAKNMSLKKESENRRRSMNDGAGSSRQPIDPSDTTETTSQMSSSAEGWNEDPQVQEKVERLKEAKEKLRRLQELVAMVQHSPDLAHALPNDLADLAASVQDDTESQFSSQARSPAAAAVAAVSRANNISAADGAAALSFQDREQLYQRKMDEQKDELHDLMQERDRLLRVQGELQHLHDALPAQPTERSRTESVNDSSRRSVDKCSKGRSEPPRPARQAPQDVTVTFQEPLETVVSNEELFDRMRQQRILREELRERKKELEQFMRKGNDRPRRHYGRNQDNQSDNVSYSNKSYQDGASASEDVTMATWGGSTAGNLESIEEGEAGRRMAHEDHDEDDAYPSDGVVQVEEEEEANGDSDRDTYTIEDEDYRLSARRDNRHQHQPMEQAPAPLGEASQQARRRQHREAESLSATAPFQDGSYTFNNWSTNNQVLNNTRNTRVKSARRRRRQQRGLSAEDNPILYKMQQDIRELRTQLDSQNSPSSSEGLQHQCSQLQQQQLLMGLNHCYYQLLQQHQQLIERFGLLENYIVEQNSDSRSPRAGRRPSDPEPRYPFDVVSERLLATASIPRKVAPKRSPLNDLSSQIPIDTIQARDMEVPLRLNLDEAVRPKKQRSPKSKPQDVVIGRRFPTPSRAGAAAMLAQQKTATAPYRPGLSAGISGTAFQATSSVSSAVSSLPGPDNDRPVRREEDVPLSLFETLRETIYSEVATLISQNENRPHFLIELFRELQLLSSDYLRQRALYSIQELVTRYLTDEKVTQTKEKPWEVHSNASNLRQPDPTSTDDEDLKQTTKEICESGDRFDYAENVATTSSMSTPTSSTQPNGSWAETPFAQESLGDTVIHLDQALRRMRDYERKLATAGQPDPQGASPTVSSAPPPAVPSRDDPQSDGSMSDVPYPRIDTQQLDKQIKSIMTEIIPVLKEHMGDVCSQQLISYIRRLVLSLAEHPPESPAAMVQQPPHSQEFVRFFKNQLASILQDSLAKFEGRKMRDCGEDMLVEMSEILFNELAFFRLMQDLDDPKAKVKARLKQWREDSCTSQTSTETAVTQDEPQFPISMANQETEDDEEEEEVSSLTSSSSRDEDGLTSETEDNEKKLPQPQDEEEELGKTRDDAFAMELAATAEEKKVNITLAPSETKPFTRIGSDEDDEAEDEVASNGEPSETAVSRDAERAAASAPSDSQSEEEKNDGEKDDDVEELLSPNDLPSQLSVISKDELASQMEAEQLTLENDLLTSLQDVQELAGDPMALKAPGDDSTIANGSLTLNLTEEQPANNSSEA